MFFLGAYIDTDADSAAVAIIRKTMRNIKNFYTVSGLFQASGAQCANILTDLYRDSKYLVRKRVFSQDRRGKKDVDAHPKIVIACQGKEIPLVVRQLRDAHIPADSLTVLPAGEAVPDSPEPDGIGRDFFASETTLVGTVAGLLDQARLLIDVEDDAATRDGTARDGDGIGTLLTDVAVNRKLPVAKTDQALFMAVAAPVWFRENVRYRQSYQSSARSVRRFT